jgi:hypothetical protein
MKGEKGDSNSFALRPASPKFFMFTLYKISDSYYSKVPYFENSISVGVLLLLGLLDPWRWDRCVVPKRRHGITTRRCVISQRRAVSVNMYLKVPYVELCRIWIVLYVELCRMLNCAVCWIVPFLNSTVCWIVPYVELCCMLNCAVFE